jgi:hypothetical protein
VRPYLFGYEFMLGHGRVIVVMQAVLAMLTLYFLQEHDVRIQLAQALAQLVQHHAAIKLRKAFVDIVCGDM